RSGFPKGVRTLCRTCITKFVRLVSRGQAVWGGCLRDAIARGGGSVLGSRKAYELYVAPASQSSYDWCHEGRRSGVDACVMRLPVAGAAFWVPERRTNFMSHLHHKVRTTGVTRAGGLGWMPA